MHGNYMKILSTCLNKSIKLEMKILNRSFNKSMQSPKGSEMGVLASPVRMENANSSHIFGYWLPGTIPFSSSSLDIFRKN